ncbi:outer membrane protein, multidrug efflux system [Campylobacter helveticus]|nr:outer membrane protein, multidrug efflux system [Campylobacter helveticus]SUW83454.1 outer membrane channel protein CmeC [Campylobacter helveticus]
MLGLIKKGGKYMRNLILILTAFFIGACSLKPNLKINEANYTSMDDNISIAKEWWKDFNDNNLNLLVEKALKNNADLKIAYINLEQAAAQLGIDRSDLLPKLDGSASANRGKSAINAPSNRAGDFSYGNDFQMGLNLSYEVDLWGKYRDNYNASYEALKASEFDYEAARLSIVSSVVQMYFNSANAYENMQIYKQTMEAYAQTYELKRSLYEIGAIGEYELAQSKAELESVKAQYTSAIDTKENYLKALKILVASDLDDILYKEEDYQKFTQFAKSLPEGISSAILLQRPDINAALSRLTQQNYLVGVARSAFLPSLSLTGLLGFESGDLDTLVKDGSKTWNVGGSFLMPIFHWGEIYQSVNLAKLSKDKAFVSYENTLKTAFAEVRYALSQRKTSLQNYENYKALLEAQQKIYDLASIRYENGSIPLIEYLDARRNLLSAKISYANANYLMANSIVEVIKAFGGGFKVSEKLSEEIEESAKSLDMSFRE